MEGTVTYYGYPDENTMEPEVTVVILALLGLAFARPNLRTRLSRQPLLRGNAYPVLFREAGMSFHTGA